MSQPQIISSFMITYGFMLSVAVDAHDRCLEETKTEAPSARIIQQNAAIAIIFSVNFLESAVNSVIDVLVYDLTELKPKNLENYLSIYTALGEKKIDNMSINEKFSLVCAGLGIPIPEKGKSLNQDIMALLSLRNALVHSRPTGFSESGDGVRRLKSVNKVLEDLRSRFTLSSSDIADATWLNPALNHEGAYWSIQTAMAYWNYLIENLLDQTSSSQILNFPHFGLVTMDKSRNNNLNIVMESVLQFGTTPVLLKGPENGIW